MKKKLVFVIPSLAAGGGEKSLVNLLNTIDYGRFEVDLVLLHRTGIFLKMLSKAVHLVDLNDEFAIFSKPLPQSLVTFLKLGKVTLAIHRLLFFLKNSGIKNKAVAEQSSWEDIRESIKTLPKHYDVAIGFLEKSSIYFAVDCITADKKIGWIHTKYSSSGMNADFDELYFEKLSNIVTVSPECLEDLQQNFPKQKDKISILYNIVSPKIIHDLAGQQPEPFDFSKNTLVTVARLSPEKGIDIALETAKILLDSKVDFQWLIIGDGLEKTMLEKKIADCKLEKHFILLGLKENPYFFIKRAAIYVQPSRYEGKSIAIDEAKILNKPIIVTDFTTAADQIDHLKNGIISGMNPDNLAKDIQMLLADKSLQNQLSLHLSQETFGTESEINKLYDLVNG